MDDLWPCNCTLNQTSHRQQRKCFPPIATLYISPPQQLSSASYVNRHLISTPLCATSSPSASRILGDSSCESLIFLNLRPSLDTRFNKNASK
ncbi:hypothetical protein IAS59_004044 [Cryptococcus gattii]